MNENVHGVLNRGLQPKFRWCWNGLRHTSGLPTEPTFQIYMFNYTKQKAANVSFCLKDKHIEKGEKERPLFLRMICHANLTGFVDIRPRDLQNLNWPYLIAGVVLKWGRRLQWNKLRHTSGLPTEPTYKIYMFNYTRQMQQVLVFVLKTNTPKSEKKNDLGSFGWHATRL